MNESIELEFKGKKLDGLILKEDKNDITIKLVSGYNANLKKSEIKELSRKKLDKKEITPIKPKKITNTNLPNITILHTGGTIASKVDYGTGAVSSKFTAEELLDLYPELNKIANITPIMISNLSSEDMNFKHYNLLLEAIGNAIKNNSDGIIISHGTDTMHYTSSALQYSLENLNVPVILVGAQRSSDRASSDAYLNLKSAVIFITNNKNLIEKYNRVGICMHSSISKESFNILDGINVKKMHSSRRDAFKQINYSPFANIDLEGNISILRNDLQTKNSQDKLSYTKYDDTLKIGFFKAHPNLFHKEIEGLNIYDGVVIEGTGLGHLAVSEFDVHTKENPNNLKAIKNLIKTTKLVIGVQTVYGETNMDIYSSGRYLKDTGILGNYMNLTTETLFCRMAYCLSKDKKNFEKVWAENLEGFEIRSIEINDN